MVGWQHLLAPWWVARACAEGLHREVCGVSASRRVSTWSIVFECVEAVS